MAGMGFQLLPPQTTIPHRFWGQLCRAGQQEVTSCATAGTQPRLGWRGNPQAQQNPRHSRSTDPDPTRRFLALQEIRKSLPGWEETRDGRSRVSQSRAGGPQCQDQSSGTKKQKEQILGSSQSQIHRKSPHRGTAPSQRCPRWFSSTSSHSHIPAGLPIPGDTRIQSFIFQKHLQAVTHPSSFPPKTRDSSNSTGSQPWDSPSRNQRRKIWDFSLVFWQINPGG